MDKPIVLIVEDSKTMRDLMVDWLSQSLPDWIITAVDTGEMAVRTIQNVIPDFVLIDIGLPGMSGYTAAKKILAFSGKIKIIMLTADETIEDQPEVKSSGAVALVMKTRMFDQLIPLLVSLSRIENTKRS